MSFEEHIMSKDKYSNIFLHQMKAIVFIIFQISLATLAVLKIGDYSWIFIQSRHTYRPIANEQK